MGRKKIGEGSTSLTISFPKDMAKKLKDHPNRSEVVVFAVANSGGELLDMDFSKLEYYRLQIIRRHIRQHIRQAVAEAIAEIDSMDLQELIEYGKKD